MGVNRDAQLKESFANIFKNSFTPFKLNTVALFDLMIVMNSFLYDFTKVINSTANIAKPIYSQKLVVQKSSCKAKYLKSKKFEAKIKDDNIISQNTSFLNLILLPSESSKEIPIAPVTIKAPPISCSGRKVSPSTKII